MKTPNTIKAGGAHECKYGERDVCAPPGFGIGKQWRIRAYEWCEADPGRPRETVDQMVLIPRGTLVHEKCHPTYWDSRETAVKALEAYRAAGIGPPYPYVLVDEANTIKGYGVFDVADDADDMAWISCMFLERRLRMAFAAPDGAGLDCSIA